MLCQRRPARWLVQVLLATIVWTTLWEQVTGELENGQCETLTPSTSADDNAWKIPGTPLSRTTGTTDDFWQFLKCDAIFATTRPLHNESTWMLLRGAYQGIVGPLQSSIVLSESNGVSYESGFQVPYYTGFVPGGVGRGVFAGQPIPQNTWVWTASKNSARFHSGADFRQFLLSIPTHLACDVLIWSYCQYIDDDQTELAIQCDLEDGSFVNTGDDTYGEDHDMYDGELGRANIGCREEHYDLHEGSYMQNLYALRDIEAGEQILVDYQEFSVAEGWEEFGLA